MKVVILGGYGPSQSVGAVFRAFQRAGHEVHHWPTLPDLQPGIPDCDLLFTFKIGQDKIPPGFIRSLAVPVKVFWNFDDPHWITHAKVPWLAMEHHLVLSSCQETLSIYRDKSCLRSYFLPPAMDLEYYKHWGECENGDAAYRYLSSFICTNLYKKRDFPNALIDRADLVVRLKTELGDSFNLWGFPPPFGHGYLNWETTLPDAIYATLCNINSHCDASRRLYFNERFFQITSTHRAQFVDRVPGFTDIFRDDEFVFYSSADELIEKIRFYEKHPASLAAIGDRGFRRLNMWTYDAFVAEVLKASEGQEPTPSFL